MNALVESQACAGAFSTEAGGLHYLWRGVGPTHQVAAIGVFDSQTELWTIEATTGPPPSGQYEGRCVAAGSYLYCFGGVQSCKDLYKLDLRSFHWAKVETINRRSERPIQKAGFGLISVNENTLACFGGYGIRTVQQESTFIKSTMHTDAQGWTNELHFFNIKQGINVQVLCPYTSWYRKLPDYLHITVHFSILSNLMSRCLVLS